MLHLEGYDGKVYKDYLHNCALFHLPLINGWIDASQPHISAQLKCLLRGSAKDIATIVLCHVFSIQ